MQIPTTSALLIIPFDLVVSSFLSAGWSAFSCQGKAFEHVAASMQADKAFVLEAMAAAGGGAGGKRALWSFVADDLQCDMEVIRCMFESASAKGGDIVPYLKAEDAAKIFGIDAVCGDRALMTHAVATNGTLLRFATPNLRADKQIVATALRSFSASSAYRVRKELKANGPILQFASEALRSDRDLVRASLFQDHRSLSFASEELQAERSFVLTSEISRLSYIQVSGAYLCLK